MNQTWLTLIAVAVVAASVFLILLLIELRKTAQVLRDTLRSLEESTKTTLDELQLTLRSLRDVSDNLKEVSGNIKDFSGTVRDVGQTIGQVNNVLEGVTSSVLIKASGLRVGVKAALGVLMSGLFKNFFKKGGGQ
jgi:uncharacterized protein YoxC